MNQTSFLYRSLELKQILDGAYGSFIVLGPNGAGKSVFGLHFAFEGLKLNKPCIYVLTTTSPQTLVRQAGGLGFDMQQAISNGLLTIVDCYSGITGNSSSANLTLGLNGGLAELFTAILKAKGNMQEYQLVFDDISSILAYSSPEAGYKFMQTVIAHMRQDRAKALFLLVPQLLDNKLEMLLLFLADGAIDMALKETPTGLKRYVRTRISRSQKPSTEWIEFDISAGGIQQAHPRNLPDTIRMEIDRLPDHFTALEIASNYMKNVDEVEKALQKLTEEGFFEDSEPAKRVGCPKCASFLLHELGKCLKCGAADFISTTLIEHYRCGNVSAEYEYKDGICPKCRKEIKINGLDYRTKRSSCKNCGNLFAEPKSNLKCRKCEHNFPMAEARWVDVKVYTKPSSVASAALLL
ncbi:MAG: hypothetical protein FJ358_07505 [Thaumarchaeota archaeon]|nr:hypothetical protein [Nitrososphaerota archaeon]